MRREPKKTDSIEVRISTETKGAFMAACKANGTSASAVLRKCVDRYLLSTSRAQSSWKEELRMVLKGKPSRRAGLVTGLGATIAAVTATVSGPAHATADARIAALFDWVDANRDGGISSAEFQASAAKSLPLGGLAILVETRVRPADEQRVDLFARLDANRDGSISLPELEAQAVVRTAADPIIKAADANGDDLFTAGELAAYITAQKAAAGVMHPDQGVAAFAQSIVAEHDANGDLMLSMAELRHDRSVRP